MSFGCERDLQGIKFGHSLNQLEMVDFGWKEASGFLKGSQKKIETHPPFFTHTKKKEVRFVYPQTYDSQSAFLEKTRSHRNTPSSVCEMLKKHSNKLGMIVASQV